MKVLCPCTQPFGIHCTNHFHQEQKHQSTEIWETLRCFVRMSTSLGREAAKTFQLQDRHLRQDTALQGCHLLGHSRICLWRIQQPTWMWKKTCHWRIRIVVQDGCNNQLERGRRHVSIELICWSYRRTHQRCAGVCFDVDEKLTLEITENRVQYDIVEELTLESFDVVLWKSVEIQIRNHPKGIAFSVKTLMLTRHHSEGAACLVKFKITINKIYSSFLWWKVVWKHSIQIHSFGWFVNRSQLGSFVESPIGCCNRVKWLTSYRAETCECTWMTCRKKECQSRTSEELALHSFLWWSWLLSKWCPINILKCNQIICLCN